MSIIGDALDAYLDVLATASTLPVTRDPAEVIQGCIYIGSPTITGRTQGAFILEVPVYLVAEGTGDSITNAWLLEQLPAFLTAGQMAQAEPRTLEVAGYTQPTYQGTATITVRSSN